jgi:hypothetical protein
MREREREREREARKTTHIPDLNWLMKKMK